MSLLQALRDKAAELTPGDIPAPGEIAGVLGTLVAALDKAGLSDEVDLDTAENGGEPKPLKDHKVAELKEIADDRGLDVEGTGSEGAVTKADLLAALGEGS